MALAGAPPRLFDELRFVSITPSNRKRTLSCCGALGLLLLMSPVALAQVSAGGMGADRDSSAAEGPQRQIEIVQADALEGFRVGTEPARLLTGQVVLRQESMTLHCDSALFFPQRNDVRAYGNVYINQADTVEVWSDSLYFNGDSRLLRLMGNVFLKDRSMLLSTPELNYNLRSRIGQYSQGGRLDNQGSVLTSTFGYYYSYSQTAYFRDSVELHHPEYSLYADTLEYRTDSDLAVFHGPTRIIHDNNTIFCRSGQYDGVEELGIFTGRAVLDGPPQRIEADSIVYQRPIGFGRAWGDVWFTDTEQDLIQFSQYGEYDENLGSMLATGRSKLSYLMSGDSIHIGADIIRSLSDSLNRREIFAFGAVRIYKSDMQAICDSMTWKDADSTISLYRDPVMWSDQTQFSADTILILIQEELIHQVRLMRSAFISSQPDTLIYNQIKGRLITGHFMASELVRLDVQGNGESIYYAEDEQKGYLGVNKALCSNMVIRLTERQPSRITFLEKTDAQFMDLNTTNYAALKLEGFSWRKAERPSSSRDLERLPEVLVAAEEGEEGLEPGLEQEPAPELEPKPAPQPESAQELEPEPEPVPPLLPDADASAPEGEEP